MHWRSWPVEDSSVAWLGWPSPNVAVPTKLPVTGPAEARALVETLPFVAALDAGGPSALGGVTEAPAPNWLTVENRIRSWLGEKIMPSDKEHKATCNDAKCHADLQHQLWAP
jgi:hypothetical protein